jgi:Bax protein
MTKTNLKTRLCVCFASIFFITSCSEAPEKDADMANAPSSEKPDFRSITDVKIKKKIFFEYIYGFVVKVNQEVLKRRIAIDVVLEKSSDDITLDDTAFIDEMSVMYLKDHDSSNTLASAKILQDYVRVISPSLALAQAANESAWGTSRFATDANNYFGQWCFKTGCGLVPRKRSSGQAHEVRKFKSPEGSVRSYIRNLNTHRAYKELRKIRDSIYQKGKKASGLQLAKGLQSYSERGEEYVEELQSMIRVNKLLEFDKKFWETISIKE